MTKTKRKSSYKNTPRGNSNIAGRWQEFKNKQDLYILFNRGENEENRWKDTNFIRDLAYKTNEVKILDLKSNVKELNEIFELYNKIKFGYWIWK